MSMLAEAHNFDFTSLLCRSKDGNDKFNVRDYVVPNKSNDEPPRDGAGLKAADARGGAYGNGGGGWRKGATGREGGPEDVSFRQEAAENAAIAAAERAAKARRDGGPLGCRRGSRRQSGPASASDSTRCQNSGVPGGNKEFVDDVTLRTPDGRNPRRESD